MPRQSKKITRIREMEARYDELSRILGELEAAVEEFRALQPELQVLRDYMESGRWQKDYEADEAGRLPASLKRGVLSEDGLYDLLQRADAIDKRVFSNNINHEE